MACSKRSSGTAGSSADPHRAPHRTLCRAHRNSVGRHAAPSLRVRRPQRQTLQEPSRLEADRSVQRCARVASGIRACGCLARIDDGHGAARHERTGAAVRAGTARGREAAIDGGPTNRLAHRARAAKQPRQAVEIDGNLCGTPRFSARSRARPPATRRASSATVNDAGKGRNLTRERGLHPVRSQAPPASQR
jgi:hypothetical protein